jgi:hypothetical protein
VRQPRALVDQSTEADDTQKHGARDGVDVGRYRTIANARLEEWQHRVDPALVGHGHGGTNLRYASRGDERFDEHLHVFGNDLIEAARFDEKRGNGPGGGRRPSGQALGTRVREHRGAQ